MARRKEREVLERIIKGFSKIRILVIGDIMMDRYILGRVSRISPEAPVPVILVEKEDFGLGGAANVAHNIHSLGGEVSLCGLVGDDENGSKLRKRLTEVGIDDRGVFVEEGRQTTVKTRIIAHHPHHQQLVRIDRETTNHPKRKTLLQLQEFLRENLERFDGVVISDYEKGLLSKKLIRTIIERAKRLNRKVMVDPKLKNFFYYQGATVVTPNTKEASEASRIPIHDKATLEKAGRILLRRLRCEVLVVTQGEEGMTIFEPHRKIFPVPTMAREVYDVTGAGDTVIASITLAMLSGGNIRNSARLANYAAGIVVGKRGTATVTPEELIKVIREKG